MVVSNPYSMSKAITIAQQILGAYDVTQSESAKHVLDKSDPTPMELGNLWRKEGFAETRKPIPRFRGETRRPKGLNLQECNVNNRMVWEVAGVCDNCQPYACKRIS